MIFANKINAKLPPTPVVDGARYAEKRKVIIIVGRMVSESKQLTRAHVTSGHFPPCTSSTWPAAKGPVNGLPITCLRLPLHSILLFSTFSKSSSHSASHCFGPFCPVGGGGIGKFLLRFYCSLLYFSWRRFYSAKRSFGICVLFRSVARCSRAVWLHTPPLPSPPPTASDGKNFRISSELDITLRGFGH